MLPANHPQRLIVADEVHARPSTAVFTPSRASYVALLVAPEDREQEFARLHALCVDHGVTPPAAGTLQFSVQLGELTLKWERHGEFSGITLLLPGAGPDAGSGSAPFAEPAVSRLPEGWLAGLPGPTLVAANALLIEADESLATSVLLDQHFDGNTAVGGAIGDGAGQAYTDFQIHDDGFSRFLIVDRSFTPRQAGRMLQRLFEIEVYRVLALLALPVAREQAPRTRRIEKALGALTTQIAAEDGQASDETLLHELTQLAAAVESGLAGTEFRFNACIAYHALVNTRIEELREHRLQAVQPIGEFMARRLSPAVSTCRHTLKRLHELSDRVAKVSGLLSTRVDITRERQNQALLASMERRTGLQLRLQQTVEGLSVAAIVYYASGLVGYLAKAGKAAHLPVDPDLVVGCALPVLFISVWLGLRRMHKKLHAADH